MRQSSIFQVAKIVYEREAQRRCIGVAFDKLGDDGRRTWLKMAKTLLQYGPYRNFRLQS